MSETTTVDDGPGQLLAEVAVLRNRTRARIRGLWLPLLVFGLLTLASIPLYRRPFAYPKAGGFRTSYRVPFVAGLPGARSQSQSELFWVLSAAVCYLLCSVWYYRRGQRQGLAPRWRRYVGLGVALFASVTSISLVPVRTLNLIPNGGRTGRVGLAEAALSPLVAIALGLFVLAWVEHSWLVGIVASAFGGITLVINTYGPGQIPPWLLRSGVGGSMKPYWVAPAHNLVVLALLLLATSAWTGQSAWRARASS
jgi:hypothetical protein